MNDAAVLAMRDQSDRANFDARLVELADALDAEFRHRDNTMGPYLQWIKQTMIALARVGKLRQCEHLQPHAPRPAFWYAVAPTELGCGDCTATLRAGDPAATCDRCDRHPATVLNGYLVASQVVDGPRASPAILIRYALCSACQALEDA